MSKKKNKNQHYLSVFYLYNFTNKEQPGLLKNKRSTKIWHYDKQKRCIKERPIEKLATKSYLFSFKNDDNEYDHSLDEKLIEVENLSAMAFSELGNIVTSFTKGTGKEIEINDFIFDNIINFLVWQIRRHPELVDDIHQQCKELRKTNGYKLKPKEMALMVIEGIGRDEYSDFESVLQKKNKSIIFTTNDLTGFITTDKPIVRFNKSSPDGIGVESTEIYFPLASNMLLYLHGKGNRKEFRQENDRGFLRRLNVYMAQKSKIYIFGASKEHVESIVKHIT